MGLTKEEIAKKMAKMQEKMAKSYGDTVVKGTEVERVSFFPSGIASIDRALGGGWAVGRLCSIYGYPSAGKTTFLLQSIANMQKIDPRACLYADAEASLDLDYAQRLGVDLDRLIVVQADTAENMTTILRNYCLEEYEEKGKTIKNDMFGCISLAVLDSTNALVPAADYGKEVNRTGGTMAGTAGLLSNWVKQMYGPLRKSGMTLICIEQVRDNVGELYGPKIKVGNGWGVAFAASQRLELVKGQNIMNKDDWAGQHIKFKVVKNKCAVPQIKGETIMSPGRGFDAEADEAYFLQESGLFVRLNNIKWSYTTNQGEVIEIKGKDNIIPTLKEKGLYDEAVANAKRLTVERANKGPKGSEELDYANAEGEEGAKNAPDEEPVV